MRISRHTDRSRTLTARPAEMSLAASAARSPGDLLAHAHPPRRTHRSAPHRPPRLGPHGAPTPRCTSVSVPKSHLAHVKRPLACDCAGVVRPRTDGPDEVRPADDVPAEDVHVARRVVRPRRLAFAHDRYEPVPRAHAAVEDVVTPGCAVTVKGLREELRVSVRKSTRRNNAPRR